MSRLGLVGDIGGTNARFALAHVAADGGVSLEDAQAFAARDHASPHSVVRAYLAAHPTRNLDFAAVACAGPVRGGQVVFTNLTWAISEADLAEAAGAPDALLINDLAAVAWSAPLLGAGDVHTIGETAVRPVADGPQAVFNVGTGTNASAYIPGADGRGSVLVGEAGHTAFAPLDEIDVEIWRRLRVRFGRVSIERLLSGPGLRNLYEVFCEIEGTAAEAFPPSDVVLRARAGDAMAVKALDRFIVLMGATAGDTALHLGATGGLFIAGGISPNLLGELSQGAFRAAFEAKGRFTDYLRAIPTHVILHPHAALLGAARAAGRPEP